MILDTPVGFELVVVVVVLVLFEIGVAAVVWLVSVTGLTEVGGVSKTVSLLKGLVAEANV